MTEWGEVVRFTPEDPSTLFCDRCKIVMEDGVNTGVDQRDAAEGDTCDVCKCRWTDGGWQ